MSSIFQEGSLLDGLSPNVIPTGFSEMFPHVMAKAGLKGVPEIAHQLAEIERQSVPKSHSHPHPPFFFITTPKHRPYNKKKQQQQHRRRAFGGGFRQSPCHSRTCILSYLLQLPCLSVRLPRTPSFTLKDSVIFRCHVPHASHLHSSTHPGLISAAIIYVCLFLGTLR